MWASRDTKAATDERRVGRPTGAAAEVNSRGAIHLNE